MFKAHGLLYHSALGLRVIKKISKTLGTQEYFSPDADGRPRTPKPQARNPTVLQLRLYYRLVSFCQRIVRLYCDPGFTIRLVISLDQGWAETVVPDPPNCGYLGSKGT